MMFPQSVPEILRLIEQDCVPGGTRQNLETAKPVTAWGKTIAHRRLLLADAQTSGGLLLAVSPRKLDAVLDLLARAQNSLARGHRKNHSKR